MKADRFYVVEIVDKLSRMLMLMFAGIILGVVLALFYYNIFDPEIGATLTVIIIYCIVFSSYVSFTNAKRNVSKVEIFKDHLSFVFEKKNEISTRTNINYSDILEYKISPLSDKKNLKLENPDKNKFSLRVFGFKTTVKTKSGEELQFQDSYSDGVLIYSPAYVFRMLDIKRYIPDFPLVLENFDSEKDPEDFKYQFEYYEKNEKTLPFSKNKKYLKCLLKYTLIFTIIAAVIALVLSYMLYAAVKTPAVITALLWTTLGILIIMTVPSYVVALFTSFFGNIFNRKTRNIIQNIIKE